MGGDDVFVRRGGDGPALLLLHGLGATGDVWDGLIALLPGSWIAPGLPGHGRSAPAPRNRYSIGGLAAAVATVLDPGAPLVAPGHSLGGGVALALASGWYRARPSAGLAGLLQPDAPFVDAAVVATDGGGRLALDPAAVAVGAPAMEGLLAAARCAVVLAAGEHDPMSPVEHLQALVPEPVVLKGLGHGG